MWWILNVRPPGLRPQGRGTGGPLRTLVFICVALTCTRISAGAAMPSDQEALAAGQLLVKFVPGGPADNEIGRLLRSGEPGSATLDDIVHSLAAVLDVPLFVRQITSGRELVLEIERSAVLDAAAGRLRGSTGVRSVSIERVGGLQRYWRDRLLIEPVSDSDLAQAASRQQDETADATLQGLIAARLSHRHYAVAAQAVSPQQIELRIDLQATTLSLVKTLKSRSGVEYAQPNFVVTIN